MFEWFSRASARASRMKRSAKPGRSRLRQQNFQRDHRSSAAAALCRPRPCRHARAVRGFRVAETVGRFLPGRQRGFRSGRPRFRAGVQTGLTRQAGHNPSGTSGGSGRRQLGQMGGGSFTRLFLTIPSGIAAQGCNQNHGCASTANKWRSSASTSPGPATVLAISSWSNWR